MNYLTASIFSEFCKIWNPYISRLKALIWSGINHYLSLQNIEYNSENLLSYHFVDSTSWRVHLKHVFLEHLIWSENVAGFACGIKWIWQVWRLSLFLYNLHKQLPREGSKIIFQKVLKCNHSDKFWKINRNLGHFNMQISNAKNL